MRPSSMGQRARLSFLSAAALLSLTAAGQVQAQETHKKNIFKRHPTASTMAAGIAAHHYAKHHGHGILHRHPMATGLAAAAAAHHYAKKK